MTDFSKYQSMRDGGSDPAAVYREARADGVDDLTMYRLLHTVFGLTFTEAKAVIVTTDTGSKTLSDAQAVLKPGLRVALRADRKQRREG